MYKVTPNRSIWILNVQAQMDDMVTDFLSITDFIDQIKLFCYYFLTMLKIRLQRIGRKNDPSFRVVCVDSKKGPKSNNNVEILGSYDPKRNYIAINNERTLKRISNGAHVSDTVHNLLIKRGIIKGKKINVSKNKKNTKNAESDKEETSVKKTQSESSEKTPIEIKSEKISADDKKKDTQNKEEKSPKEEINKLLK